MTGKFLLAGTIVKCEKLCYNRGEIKKGGTEMLLTIDIGNSNISLGVFRDEDLLLRAKLSAQSERSSDEYAAAISDQLRLGGIECGALTGCILSSVVPALTELVERAVVRLTGLSVLRVGPGVKTGFRIRIDDPSQLGGDLVADTAAALAEYGSPLIIIDAGTVTTISAVDGENTYLGCSILPGIHASAAQLKASTALLPSIAIGGVEDGCLGRNSADSMRCGLLLGNAMMVDGFVERFRSLSGMAGAKVIVTGGSGQLVTAHCRTDVTYDPDLTLKGLRRLYDGSKARGRRS